MKKCTITAKTSGRLLKILSENLPEIKYASLSSALRKKDVIVDGNRTNENITVSAGGKIEIFLPESAYKTDFSVFYEDENILIVNKNKGIEICDGNYNIANILRRSYSEIKPVHRLDRNTSGLCVFAKNADVLAALIDALRNKEIRKFYRAETASLPPSDCETFVDYMIKNAAKSRVKVYSSPVLGSVKTVTKYKFLYPTRYGAMLDVEITGGFTHQIRASLAYHGMPILGDGKYGDNSANKKSGYRYQRLCAYKLVFCLSDNSPLRYLNNIKIAIKDEDIKL